MARELVIGKTGSGALTTQVICEMISHQKAIGMEILTFWLIAGIVTILPILARLAYHGDPMKHSGLAKNIAGVLIYRVFLPQFHRFI
jgi:uncharacterized membrane protein